MIRFAAMLLLLEFPGTPQETRDVSGMVTDKRGNALPSAAVQLENTATLVVMSSITGKDGVYHFNNIRSDIDYTLKAKYRRWWSERKTVSKFNSAKHVDVVLVIPID